MFSIRNMPPLSKVLAFLALVFLYTYLLRFLWNNVLVNSVTILRPIKTLWQTFLLAVALTLWGHA
ncbi:hypothetical protein EBT31_03725 [bacterium]|nr:hypothetical protein [bacterium]NBX48820.1 hypothetical protein [bacterium]